MSKRTPNEIRENYLRDVARTETGEWALTPASEDIGVLLAERDTLHSQVAELVEALEDMTKRHAQTFKENGGCDHSVGICWCDDIRALDDARAALARAKGEK